MTKNRLLFLLSMLMCVCGSKSFAQASKYYKAANQGDVTAQYNLGVCYHNGNGVAKDYAKAVYWYSKAANQGHASAQCNLGFCYKNGEGVTKNYAKAVYWYSKAANQGDASAQCNLGFCYDNGNGVTKNYAKAVYWYSKAANQGDASAQCNLGFCYDNGNGVTKNYAKAVYWYSKAANQGDALAQYNLGLCYENGSGVTKNYAKAVYWYRKAAAQGHAKAKQYLEEIEGMQMPKDNEDSKQMTSSSDLPDVIDLTIDGVLVESVEDGVKNSFKVTDVKLLHIYRSGTIELGNKELAKFDVAESYEFKDNCVQFREEDNWYGNSVILDTDENKLTSISMTDSDNRLIIIIFFNKQESTKLQKIYQFVEQNKFVKK